ncbi:MAG: SMC family ATPase, partial [Acidobacteria bacterium]|nr:SMC family ATPase [Acidobacteriota bacterium]
MHITRVELENIKSYERGEFNFQPGTTAIVGRNGAGKTTILEAVAWALFDSLDYSKDDFLRRGAKKGWVRVTFVSDLDGRQYTVYRDTGNGYYVHDPVLNAQIAQKKTNVGAFLHQHLGVEPGTDVGALFKSAIGVPQGTLTADFLKPVSQRKASFDPLLKVEEYLKGAERLRDTSNLIRDRSLEAHKRIANHEGQLARYDELATEHEIVAQRASELSKMLVELRQETKERELLVAEMDQAERLVNEAQAAVQQTGIERVAIEQRLRDLESVLESARHARARQQATEADYRAHSAAQEQLRALEAERAEREKLRHEATNAARLVDAAENEGRRLGDALARAESARLALAELEREVSRQEELERERERLRELLARARAANERLTILDRELEILRRQHVETKTLVKGAEAARADAQKVERLHSERTQIETELSKAEKDKTAREHLTQQRQELTREIKRLHGVVKTLERQTRELETRTAGAERAAELEADERALAEQAAQLRAEIARDEKVRAEIKGGVCPLLGHRCTSFSEGKNFADYFAEQVAANRTQLAAVKTQAESIGKAVRAAREAGIALIQLERERAQHAHERNLLQAREESLAALERQLAALPADDRRLNELRSKLTGLDGELITAREALLRYEKLEPLRQRLQEIDDEGIRKKEDRAQLTADAGAVAGIEQDIAETDKQLRALADPRGRAAALKQEAARETTLKAEVQAAAKALAQREAEQRALERELQRFSELDTKWTEAIAERDRTANAQQEYLTSKVLADTLPAREAEVK